MGTKSRTLTDLFLHQLKDLYYAEKHVGKVLPKLSKATETEALQAALDAHRDATHTHVERLDAIFELLDKKVHAIPCEAIQGLIEETKEVLQDFEDSEVIDAAVIAAAQAIAHYEIARYGALKVWASKLGLEEAGKLIEMTLGEEKRALDRLTELAGSLAPPPEAVSPEAGRLTLKQAALSGIG